MSSLVMNFIDEIINPIPKFTDTIKSCSFDSAEIAFLTLNLRAPDCLEFLRTLIYNFSDETFYSKSRVHRSR